MDVVLAFCYCFCAYTQSGVEGVEFLLPVCFAGQGPFLYLV